MEMSKVMMYDHHYNDVMTKYGHQNAKLMMTDTYSPLYYTKTEDICKDMLEDKHLFEFSNYSKNTYYMTARMLKSQVYLRTKLEVFLLNNLPV